MNKQTFTSQDRRVEHQRKFFNSLHDSYEKGNMMNLPSLESARKLISPHIFGDVLDIGNGGSICFDIKKARSVTLADLAIKLLRNPKIVDKGRFRAVDKSKLRCVEANVLNLSFKDKSFDVVLLLWVAHHLSVSSKGGSKRNVNRAFSEISRILRKDGLFILAENCPAGFVKFFLDLGYPFWYFLLSKVNKPLPYFMSRGEIEQLLKKNGLTIIKKNNLAFGKKAYQPLFPFFAPPGWLWGMLMGSRLFLVKKDS
ncbi:MAG: class I SAM-dependent methyltransferase [bacterium]|nr:class I SAM-dependent methyltransferase [bacterium]